MTKDEWYNNLLEQVQKEGGYIAFEKENRPVVTIYDGETDIIVAAIFEGTDDSSPLKIVDSDFHCWDLYDYVSGFGLLTIVDTYNNQKKK